MNTKEGTLNIYQRINAVMNEVKYIKKDEKAAKGLPYTFVSHDAVIGVLHVPMTKHGIAVVSTVSEMKQDGNRTTAKVDVSFINIDDPKDRVIVTYYGYGIDGQDKGPGKAYSYAVKYALLKTFCLETGDDPERENIEYRTSLITKSQIQEIELRINGHEELKKQILGHIPGKDLKNLTQDRFDGVIRWVEKFISENTK